MSSLEDFMIPCLNKQIFGFDCMGCGLQRSLSLIFHGEFVAAFYMYPAIYTLLILFLYIIINSFNNFKNANKIILTLVIINAILIVGNFLLKLI